MPPLRSAIPHSVSIPKPTASITIARGTIPRADRGVLIERVGGVADGRRRGRIVEPAIVGRGTLLVLSASVTNIVAV